MPYTSRFDPEPMQGSPAGTTAATADGRPITTGRRSSTREAMPDQYATNSAAFAPAMPKSSTSKQRWAIFYRNRATDVLALGQGLVEREAVGSLRLSKPGQTQALAGRSIRGR